MREVCALRHLSINTEKSYTHWLGRFGAFLKDKTFKSSTSAMKMEAFLTRLALTGVSASTQNQAFNALLFFYRDVLKQDLGPVDSLRAKQPVSVFQCPSPEEVRQLLAAISDIYRYPTRLIVHLLYGCGGDGQHAGEGVRGLITGRRRKPAADGKMGNGDRPR